MAHVEKLVETAVVGAVEELETKLDSEIARLDALQDDDLESIRRRRLAQLKKAAEDRAVWQRNGHGRVVQLAEKEFFTRAKSAPRMVVIMMRPGSSRYAEDLIAHVGRVAARHLECFFGVIDVAKAPFLVGRLKIKVLPSVVMVEGGEIRSVLAGLDALEPTGKFTTEKIERRLFEMSMLTDTNIADGNDD